MLAAAWISCWRHWMTLDALCQSVQFTEVLCCSSKWHQHQVPTRPVCFSCTAIPPVSSVHDLGVHIDSDLTMSSQPPVCASWHYIRFVVYGTLWHVKLCCTVMWHFQPLVHHIWMSHSLPCIICIMTMLIWHHLLVIVPVSWSWVVLIVFAVLFVEIPPSDKQSWPSSSWAGNCTQRSTGRTEQSRLSTEPAEAGNFIFCCTCWG